MRSNLLSVIIPVYNVAEYLPRCIDSILAQTYTDIEIILVDDGSTDTSGQICDEYAKNHNNITAYHKTNGGLSSARNYGIEKSFGEFITFVDSDDYIGDDKTYEYVLSHSRNPNVDIIGFPHKICHSSKTEDQYCPRIEEFGKQQYVKFSEKQFIFSEFRVANSWKRGLISTSACDKVYRKSLFQDIKFKKMFLEDIYTNVILLQKAKTIVIESRGIYCYCQRENSLITSRWSENKYKDDLCAFISVYQALQNYIPNSPQALETYLAIVSKLTAYKSTFGINYLKKYQVSKLNTPQINSKSFYNNIRLLLIRTIGISSYIEIATRIGKVVKFNQ